MLLRLPTDCQLEAVVESRQLLATSSSPSPANSPYEPPRHTAAAQRSFPDTLLHFYRPEAAPFEGCPPVKASLCLPPRLALFRKQERDHVVLLAVPLQPTTITLSLQTFSIYRQPPTRPTSRPISRRPNYLSVSTLSPRHPKLAQNGYPPE